MLQKGEQKKDNKGIDNDIDGGLMSYVLDE